jgi:hypothetical protein
MDLINSLKKPAKQILLGLQPPAPECAWRVEPQELADVQIVWPRSFQWPYALGWVEPLLEGFRRRVPLTIADIPQRLTSTVVIELRRKNRTHRVAINCSDYPDMIHLHAPEASLDLEFKMQYLREGYGESRIVPGGYVSNSMLIDWYARGPQRTRDQQHFRWDVYGRFGTQFATDVRAKAIQMLQEQRRVQFFGGHRKVHFTKFLKEIAQSRVCLDLPGNGPFCFRFINYLAVGACVISPPQATTLPAPLIDRKHVVYTKPDMSDLVDLCEHYVNDTRARETIVSNARQYYRQHLYWRSLSDYYLRTMLDRLH